MLTVNHDGKFDTEFEHEQQPAFDHKPVPKAYALDLQYFKCNEESTPDWLKEIVQQHGLAYHEPEPLA